MKRLRAGMNRLRARYGERRVNWLATLVLIGIGAGGVHLLARHNLDSSALLYVGLPYLGALAIVVVRPQRSNQSIAHKYRDFALTSLVVFLGSSIVLFEGFVCVLFFAPIYFLVVSLGFVIDWLAERSAKKRGRTLGIVLPVVILGSSLEGTTEAFSAQRMAHVEASRTANLTPEQVMRNLTRPMNLDAGSSSPATVPSGS